MVRQLLLSLILLPAFVLPVMVLAQDAESVGQRLAEIAAEQDAMVARCSTIRRNAPDTLQRDARVEHGECRLAAARIAWAEIDALSAGLSAGRALLEAEKAAMDVFLETYLRLHDAAGDNAGLQQQINRLRDQAEAARTEADRLTTETAVIAAETDQHAASADRHRARSAQYEAQIACIRDTIAHDTQSDCHDPAVWRRFLPRR